MSDESARTQKTPGLLIVEGDANTLRAQGHTKFIDSIVDALAPTVEKGELRLKRLSIRSEHDLGMAKWLAQFSTYDAAIILAHSAPSGVQVAPGVAMSWKDVATAIAPTRPRCLLAVACFGATSTATDALFDGVPSLDRIVGSPAPLTTTQATGALLELMVATRGASLPTEWAYLVNIANAALTSGVLFTRTRAGLESSTPYERAFEDLAGFLAWAMIQGL